MMGQTNTSEPRTRNNLSKYDTHNERRSFGNVWSTCVGNNFEGKGMGADFDTLVHENEQGQVINVQLGTNLL